MSPFIPDASYECSERIAQNAYIGEVEGCHKDPNSVCDHPLTDARVFIDYYRCMQYYVSVFPGLVGVAAEEMRGRFGMKPGAAKRVRGSELADYAWRIE